MAKKKVYFNKPQRLTQLIGANTTVIVAGQPRDHKIVLRQVRAQGLAGGSRVPRQSYVCHDEKYLLINQGFAGKQRLVAFFNRSNNEDLILAIQSAGVSRGRNGFFL